MLATGPRPPDIPFDHAAAAAAVAALDRAGAVLADVADARSGASGTARARFAGLYADDFTEADADLGGTSVEARSVVRALRTSVVEAAAAARAAQTARLDEQRAWDAAATDPLPPGVA